MCAKRCIFDETVQWHYKTALHTCQQHIYGACLNPDAQGHSRVRCGVFGGASNFGIRALMRGRENNLPVRTRGTGPRDEASGGKDTKGSLEDL